MTLFLVGIAILIVGGLAYGAYCEKVFGPDDRQTPAVASYFRSNKTKAYFQK